MIIEVRWVKCTYGQENPKEENQKLVGQHIKKIRTTKSASMENERFTGVGTELHR